MNQPLVKHKYVWLDLIRALAAMEVFLGHLRTLLFKNYWKGSSSIAKKVFYFFTGFSHEAVIVFFVLSGFFITGAIVNASEKGKFSILNYGLDRLVRLWIVLIPGLVLTFIVDRLGLFYFSNNPAYTGTLRYLGNINVQENLNLRTFLGNIFFLQTIFVNPFGSNGPLWSLSNEFWYYVLFPLIFFVYFSKKILTKGLLMVLALVVFLFIGKNVALYFLIWLIGSVLFFTKKNLSEPSAVFKNVLLLAGSASFIFCFYELRTGGRSDWAKDFLSGIVTGVLCYAGLFKNMKSAVAVKLISFFSGISYSLYVIHLPLCIFITSLIAGSQKNWSLSWFLIYLLISVVILGGVIIFWYCFESRYLQVRAFLKKKFSGSIRPAL